MAIDSSKRALHRIDDRDGEVDGNNGDVSRNADRPSGSQTPRIRIKSATRPRSYHHILEDFKSSEQALSSSGGSRPTVETESPVAQEETDSLAGVERESVANSSPRSPVDNQLSTLGGKEDTVRRHKRFSLPAIALQTTPVTARPNATGEGRSKRFSLVLNGRSNGQQTSDIQYAAGESNGNLSSGIAAAKLGELLGRQK